MNSHPSTTMKKPSIRNILVPVDFSELSLRAIETAQRLARSFEATVHLVHVHEYHYLFEYMAPTESVSIAATTFLDQAAQRAAENLRKLAKNYELPQAHCYLREGSPVFNEINKVARTIEADLIVMPTHGWTGLKHLFLGTTAERVVQHAPCPVLVTRQRETKPKRTASEDLMHGRVDTILVPVDFSQTSFSALGYAIDFAERMAAKLIVLHAVDLSAALTTDGGGLYNLSAITEAEREDAEIQMRKLVHLAKFRGVKFETAIKTGDAVSEICATAQECDVDLIITATHGRTGFKHLLMGSVAERVVRHATRSVLVVPSHPEVRAAGVARGSGRAEQGKRQPASANRRLTRRNHKLMAIPFPERRKTNKFRESHSA